MALSCQKTDVEAPRYGQSPWEACLSPSSLTVAETDFPGSRDSRGCEFCASVSALLPLSPNVAIVQTDV